MYEDNLLTKFRLLAIFQWTCSIWNYKNFLSHNQIHFTISPINDIYNNIINKHFNQFTVIPNFLKGTLLMMAETTCTWTCTCTTEWAMKRCFELLELSFTCTCACTCITQYQCPKKRVFQCILIYYLHVHVNTVHVHVHVHVDIHSCMSVHVQHKQDQFSIIGYF